MFRYLKTHKLFIACILVGIVVVFAPFVLKYEENKALSPDQITKARAQYPTYAQTPTESPAPEKVFYVLAQIQDVEKPLLHAKVKKIIAKTPAATGLYDESTFTLSCDVLPDDFTLAAGTTLVLRTSPTTDQPNPNYTFSTEGTFYVVNKEYVLPMSGSDDLAGKTLASLEERIQKSVEEGAE